MKTEEEIIEKSNAIIDSLKDCTVAEKLRIISSLYRSLKDTMKSEGMEIIKDEAQE